MSAYSGLITTIPSEEFLDFRPPEFYISKRRSSCSQAECLDLVYIVSGQESLYAKCELRLCHTFIFVCTIFSSRPNLGVSRCAPVFTFRSDCVFVGFAKNSNWIRRLIVITFLHKKLKVVRLWFTDRRRWFGIWTCFRQFCEYCTLYLAGIEAKI